jgi:hypothetical protein
MDSLKTATTPAPTYVPVRTQVGPPDLNAKGGSTSPHPTDSYRPGEAPLQIFLTPAQVMAMFKAEEKTTIPEAPAPAQNEKSLNDKLKDAVPGPIKAVVDGVTIPGTQASIKPRFDNGGFKGGPTGLDFKLKF